MTNLEKQIRTEVKPILSTTSGEVFMPRIKPKVNFVNKNKLLWILSGQVYQAPINSFLNFYTDHKINKNSYIFRTKLINNYSGLVNLVNNKTDLPYPAPPALIKQLLSFLTSSKKSVLYVSY